MSKNVGEISGFLELTRPLSKPQERVHIVGAGGPAGIGMARCLKNHYETTGEDSSTWPSLAMEACPGSRDGAQLVVPVPDAAVFNYANQTTFPTFLPSFAQVELAQDKAKMAEVLGEIAPKTYWIRDTHGAGGAGAQMISEYLPGKNFSVEFVFSGGKMLAYFQKERLSYLVKRVEPVPTFSGSSAVSVCTDHEDVTEVAAEAVRRLCQKTKTPPHGFYGVDLREDEEGLPRVTEINAGRLLTASYSYFWKTGYNLPMVGVRAALGGDPFPLPPYPLGWGVIRQVDQQPTMCPPDITKQWK